MKILAISHEGDPLFVRDERGHDFEVEVYWIGDARFRDWADGGPVTHYHHCPYCYESFLCKLGCTIEPDLEDRGRSFGSHAVCHDIRCHIARAADKYNERRELRQRDALRRLQSPRKMLERELARSGVTHTEVVAEILLAVSKSVESR